MIGMYATPAAYRQALEQRIRASAKNAGVDMSRHRQVLIYDRFLARVFAELGTRAIVKGGVVLELRLERARTTRDVDLRLMENPAEVLGQLQRAGQRDLGDALTFAIAADAAHPEIEGDGVVYGGKRFVAQCSIAGVRYGLPFGVDAGFGDVLTVDPEVIAGTTFFTFVGAEPAQHRVYPRVTHIAEKLHAYTLPRRNQNSRVKDLPDLALLVRTGTFSQDEIRKAIDTTFGFRNTHGVPSEVPPPPTSWHQVYARMALDDELPWRTIEDVYAAVCAFVNPVLLAAAGRTWDPALERWA
jgi:hypothetical protein